jgi:hypothetical protein
LLDKKNLKRMDDRQEGRSIVLYSNWFVPGGARCRLERPSRLTMSGVTPNRSIAMDRSAADMLSEFYMKFFRRIAMKRVHRMQRHVRAVVGFRPASSMDDDGCGICDECLAP